MKRKNLAHKLVFDMAELNEAVDAIRQDIASASKHWLNACKKLVVAKEELSVEAFEVLPKMVGLSKSSIYKMLKIGSSERLVEYEEKLANVGGWSVLHQITLLEDNEFDSFKRDFLSGSSPMEIERQHVQKYRIGDAGNSGTCATSRDKSKRRFATVTVDLDTLYEVSDAEGELEKLKDAIEALTASKFVTVDLGDALKRIEDELEKRWQAEGTAMVRKANKIKRDALEQAYKEELDKLPYGKKNEKGFIEQWGYNREELFGFDDHNEGLELLGREPIPDHQLYSM